MFFRAFFKNGINWRKKIQLGWREERKRREGRGRGRAGEEEGKKGKRRERERETKHRSSWLPKSFLKQRNSTMAAVLRSGNPKGNPRNRPFNLLAIASFVKKNILGGSIQCKAD